MEKIYIYDNDGYFEGEDFPQIDPLESQKAGREILIMPANSTDIEPPEEKEGFRIKWNGSTWEYEEIPEEPERQDLPLEEQAQREPTREEQRQNRRMAYAFEVDGITAHIQRERDKAEPDEEKISSLIAERAEKVAEIKEMFPYPVEAEE